MPAQRMLLTARVPRYTSYPTAPHFHAGIGDAAYRAWLEELTPEAPISLYLHIPFCDTLCWFCACHTTVVNHNKPIQEYCSLLLQEIREVARILDGRNPVAHIHWGGGSPTLVDDADMINLVRNIKDLFPVISGTEMAVEIDPRGFDAKKAELLSSLGVTRASIGLQDCDPKVQKAINRIQPEEDLRRTVRLLRGHGIGDINLDLIYGLPYQTAASFERTLDFTVQLAPRRIAIFGYAHVPSFKKHQALIPERALPDVAQRLELAQLAEYSLRAAGYQPVGLDHFAHPDDPLARAARSGSLKRNFQGYTVDDAPALIGLGASAVSALPQGYAQNAVSVRDYRQALTGGRLPVVKGIALSDEDRLRREVIEQLMCFLRADLGDICLRHGKEAQHLDWALAELEPLRAEGALLMSGRLITISPEMRPAARLASAVFDAFLDASVVRHSLSA
jgi:oxygen-independent coproporphyrinogen III oxidase